jgi:hypothetical protein
MEKTEYNERYLLYCKSNNLSFDEQLEKDKKEYPGGCMTGYIIFIGKMYGKFFQNHPEYFDGQYIRDQEQFTKFIEQNV